MGQRDCGIAGRASIVLLETLDYSVTRGLREQEITSHEMWPGILNRVAPVWRTAVFELAIACSLQSRQGEGGEKITL